MGRNRNREGLQIQKGNQLGYFLLAEKTERSVYMELKKRAERKTGRELYMGIFEGCMEKLRILFGLLRWPSRYSFSVIMIKKRNWCFSEED